jgi:hypothetical protein
MRLIGNPVGVPICTTGPYLQKATTSSILIRWYTDEAVDSKVMYGNAPGNLTQSVTVSGSRTNHSVPLTGLAPSTKYYYSIGSTSTTIQSGTDNYFVTSALPNSNGKYTFWVTGDMGDGSMRQLNVLNAFNTYMGSNETHGWICLGDNAYNNGTVGAYTSNFFDVYESTVLRKTPLWPATGNHEYANNAARQVDHNIPYFDYFDLPTNGEAGGVQSNSEAYYSFDYGDIHFIALDSYIIESGFRLYDMASPQIAWLQSDLAANTKKWTIVYFHHPPFTMGSHNSDTESELILLRQNLAPILEQYDVDLVLNGHSHSYERSKLQKDHFGLESTFDPALHQVSQSSGKYDGTANSCVYTKNSPADLGGTVYVVAGSAGKLDPGQATFPHDAMYYGNDDISGSLILEIEGNRLDAKWLSASGNIEDNFTIMKEVNQVNNIDVVSGSSVTMTASWPGQYNWSSGQTTRSHTVTPASSTTFTVTDPYSCITDTFNLNVIGAPLTIDIPSVGFSQVCAGSDVSIGYTISGTFTAGNIFTLQMSNSSGSFASPVTIGTRNSTTAGTINGVIPANTPTGVNYRFRIISSNPVFTGSASVTFTVNILSAPSVGTITQPTCSVATGSVELSNLPSSGTWTLTRSPGGATTTGSGTSTTITGLTTGTYTYTVTNASGCISTSSGNVVINAQPVTPTAPTVGTITQPTCSVATGSVVLNNLPSSGTWTLTRSPGGATTTGSGTSTTISGLATGTYTYTVTNASGCVSTSSGNVVIDAQPATPATPGVSSLVYCQNATAVPLTATSLSGNTLQWYGTNATGGTAGTIAPTPATGSTGTTTYYVSQKNDITGCESARAGIVVTVNALPGLPTAGSVSYCHNATASPLSATATSGNTLQWYGTNATGGTASTTVPTPSTNSVGVITYYVSQKNTATGCESARLGIAVTVNPIPGLPGVSDFSYCQNSIAPPLTATASGGHALRWYGTNATGGTASTTAPTPSTAVIGSTDYYVSQLNLSTGCESARAQITVHISDIPEPPVVSDESYCQNEISVPLTAIPLSGHVLLWYGTNATGGSASATPPTPATSAPGITDYYVSQQSTLAGCTGESSRARIRVTVNPIPALPGVSNIDYCQGATASALTATATTGHTLQWYASSTGGTASTVAPTPSTSVVGTTSYYVSQKNNSTGCEGARAVITVVVNATPPMPGVSGVAYCQGATASALTATASAGYTLLWYGTNATGGTASTTAPIPSTSTAGVMNYYVSQRKVGEDCEGPRASIAVTITSTAPPIITATGIGTADVLLTSSAPTGNQWFKDGVAITGATANTYAVTENGVYQVSASNGSCNTTLSEALTVIITDVKESGLPVQLKVYPVPAREAINIQLSGVEDDEVAEVMVIDMSGRVIARQKIRGKESTLIIEEYPVGDYFLRVTNQAYLLHSRFVKY